MAVMTDLLLPVLEDAREAHTAVADRFRSDMALTSPGLDRQRLERQTADTERAVERIEHRVREVQPSGLLAGTERMVRALARGVVQATAMPVRVGTVVVTGLLRGVQFADERQLLKNMEDEYAAAARALAACRAGESIAEQLDDRETAGLLALLRRQDEQLLENLEDQVAQHARAAAAAAEGHRPAQAGAGERGGRLLDTVVRTVRINLDQLRATLRTGTRRVVATAEGAWREAEGAVTREEDLPLPGFSELGVTEIEQRLRDLSQNELTVIEGFERAHAGRSAVLDVIEGLREPEPWPGFDTMDPERIKMHLRDVPVSVARQALEYERRHRKRQTVINAAQEHLAM
jgi:hypothetical protein